ncbi:hypothetical protein SLUN_28570 [Streptomyces lunaelactis]|uniref:DUF2971 domain-containing protein n=1 Tax=Streptomyces lunaelactis TaxID=1535768 RepID=A0A2R4T8W1_9ACTN|nr:DUF2971 domain-containing protein [Streptomyces lunaelactis]AVZ75573.1 hypothetical protein SLUN_28570 [Streptomyces lunaelactis]NUK87922.1 DUF2971 domain-containing protein [Streptomyces lunaelactis]
MAESIMIPPDGLQKLRSDWFKDFRQRNPAPSRLKRAYHYTDQAGLQGIMSSGNIRAADVEFLNDAQELIYARDNLLSILRVEEQNITLRDQQANGKLRLDRHANIIKELRLREQRRARRKVHMKAPDETGLLPVLSDIIADLQRVGGPSESSPCHIYVCCFCGNGDLLSQWRGYGGVGGYAIGFRPDMLESLSNREDGEFDWIRYGFDLACYGDHRLLPRSLHPGITLMQDYLKALTMVKDPSFEEEQEWRLMIPREVIGDDVEFRPGPVGVTPYIPLKFTPDAVDEVIVGPGRHPMERMNGTRQLLDRFGAKKAKVTPSASSLRL